VTQKILEVRGLSRIYGHGCPRCVDSTGPEHDTNICRHCGSIVALHGVSFDLFRGEILGIIGESGSGKSSTVKLLYFDEAPSAGEARFFDEGVQHDLFRQNAAQQRGLRNKRFGMVYQNPHQGLNFQVSAGGNIAERLLMSDVAHYGEIRRRSRELLARTGQRIRDLSRKQDWCFRYGGDEFVIMMPETGPEAALAQAMEVHRSLIETRFRMKNGINLRVEASVGVATAPMDGKTVHEAIGAADARMYSVKSVGRGSVRGA